MIKIQIINLMFVLTILTLTGKTQNLTNDFYDDAETYNLAGSTIIELGGEIGNPGTIDITELPLRSLIIKEAISTGDSNRFIGAYRYDGYSLYDLLNAVVLKKKNETEFPPIIDLYVKVENDKGESVVFSWGELYYPVHRHEIIIAVKVARIVPSKTKDLWPLPQDIKIVAGHDLITERNISNPVRITVLSADVSYPINRELTPLYSADFRIMNGYQDTEKNTTTSGTGHQQKYEAIFYDEGDQYVAKISSSPESTQTMKYETIFYGRGRGIHSTTPFQGIPLKSYLNPYFNTTGENLRTGLFVIASTDGYRCIFTFSEILNRNDQAEVLLIEDPENQDGGAFRLFPAADFFSDRAVKAVTEIRFLKE